MNIQKIFLNSIFISSLHYKNNINTPFINYITVNTLILCYIVTK